MNVRKLLARLNPPIKQVQVGVDRTRYVGHSGSMARALERQGSYRPSERLPGGAVVLGDLYRGMPSPARIEGVSETRSGFNPDAMTAIDIAHALGCVQDVFAREIFCHLWWPDGAARTRGALEQLIHTALMHEHSNRARERVAAKLELHLVETNAQRWRPEDKQHVARARRRLAKAEDRSWPGNLETYPRLIDAVLNELADFHHCAYCGGRGETLVGAMPRPCTTCNGVGILAASERDRAEAIGKGLSVYQRSWKSPYDWLYRQCSQKENFAARVIREALMREEDQAVA